MERAAVFDRTEAVEKADLPEDLDRKIEVRHKKEVFEAEELQELKELVDPHYENGKKIAGHIESLNSHKEHHPPLPAICRELSQYARLPADGAPCGN